MDEQTYNALITDLLAIRVKCISDDFCTGLGAEVEMICMSANRIAEELDPRTFTDEQRRQVFSLLRVALSFREVYPLER